MQIFKDLLTKRTKQTAQTDNDQVALKPSEDSFFSSFKGKRCEGYNVKSFNCTGSIEAFWSWNSGK